MTLLRHLLRFGGLYIVGAVTCASLCYATYVMIRYLGWRDLVVAGAMSGLAAWAMIGAIKS